MNNKKIIIGKNIHGILTYPQKFNSIKRYPTLLMLHGLGSDKNEVNHFYEKLAESFAKNNFLILRIDFTGFGESPRNSETSSLETMQEDVKLAMDYLRNLENVNENYLGFIGFSLGAGIAALMLNIFSPLMFIAISPAVNFLEDFTLFLGKENIKKFQNNEPFIELQLPWRKLKLSNIFFQSLTKFNALNEIKNYTGYIYCVAGKNDFSFRNAKKIYSATNRKITLNFIEEANHIFDTPNGINLLSNVAQDIIAWCKNII